MFKNLLLYCGICIGLFLTPNLFGQIKCLDKIDEHKPIIMESETEANVYKWSMSKQISKISLENGRIIHCWAPPGKYDIGLMTITVDFDKKDIQFNEHEFILEVVKGNLPPTPPTPPTPPNPPTPPVPPQTAFKQAVASALAKVPTAGQQYKVKIAEVYSGIALEAESQPNAWDAATMVNEAKVRNSGALPVSALTDWKDFWSGLATAFRNLKLSATDLQGHIKAFKEVAEVLKG